MVSNKNKRVVAVTAVAASLLLGGVAAAQADGPACRHGKGKGLGIGAPGQGKGKGAEKGWPQGCKDKNNDEDGAPAPDVSGEPEAAAPETPETSATPDAEVGGSSTAGAETGGSAVNVEVSAEVTVPDAGQIAAQAVQDVRSFVRPVVQTVVSEVQQAAEEVKSTATAEVAGIVALLRSIEPDITVAGQVNAGGNLLVAALSLAL